MVSNWPPFLRNFTQHSQFDIIIETTDFPVAQMARKQDTIALTCQ